MDIGDEDGKKIKEFHELARDGQLTQLQRLITAYNIVDVDVPDDKNQTALMWASWCGDVEVVEYLVNMGANVNAKDKTGCTPLMWAVDHDCLEVVEYLIEKCSAEVNPKNRRNYTPLMHAAANNNVEILNYLLKAGSDVNAVDFEFGYSPVMWAVDNGHLEAVKYLVEKGKASFAVINKMGLSALEMATDEAILKYIQEINPSSAVATPVECQATDAATTHHASLVPHLRTQLVNLEFQLKLEQKKAAEYKRQMQDYSNAALETISQEYSTNDGLRRQLCLCQEKCKRLVLEYRPPLEHFSSVEVCDRALRALTITFKDILAIKNSLQKDAPDCIDNDTITTICCTFCGKDEQQVHSFPFEPMRICKGCAMEHNEMAQCNCFVYKRTIDTTSRVYGLR